MKDKNLILNSETKNAKVTPCLGSFCTYYGYTSEAGNQRMGRQACFSNIFNTLRSNINYRVKYKIKINYLGNQQARNFCCLNEAYMKKHIRELRKFVDMKYRFIKRSGYYLLHIEITANGLYHKLALAWIRYLYEFPFNVILADYTLMSGHFKFEKLNMINIMLNSLDGETHTKIVHGICYKNLAVTICDVPSLQEQNKFSGGCDRLEDLINLYSLIAVQTNDFKSFPLRGEYKSIFANDNIQKRFKIYKENLKQIQEELKDEQQG